MAAENNITVHVIMPTELDGIITPEEYKNVTEKLVHAVDKISHMHSFKESDITIYYEPEDKHLHMQLNFGGFNARELNAIADALI